MNIPSHSSKVATAALAIAFALPATAQAAPVQHPREVAAITHYAASQGGTVTGCRISGRHGRNERCAVSIPIYLHPSGTLFGNDVATISAFRVPGWSGIYTEREGPWTLTTIPGLS